MILLCPSFKSISEGFVYVFSDLLVSFLIITWERGNLWDWDNNFLAPCLWVDQTSIRQ